MTTSRNGMTTTKRLHLMLIFTIVFALFSLFSIAQLSKALQLHHLNFIFIQNIETLSNAIEQHAEKPLTAKQTVEQLKRIKQTQEECLTVFNKVNGYIFKFGQTKRITSICKENRSIVNTLINNLINYEDERMSDAKVIDSLTHASNKLKINSGGFEEPVNEFANSIKMMIKSLFLPAL